MISYDALPTLLRTALMLGLFLTLCGSIYVLSATIRRRSPVLFTLTLLCTLLSGCMMILFSADVRSTKHALAFASVSRWLCEKPAVFIILLWAAMAAFLVYAVIWEMKRRRTMVTRSAIKESIDHLDTGLCFFAENGRVMLVNHRMNQLCHTILGHDLQNAALMWDEICEGDVQPNITRLLENDQPSFLLPDGTVWTFSGEDLQRVFQITAADATQLHSLAEEIKHKNIALEALNHRLVQYEKNVEELTRSKERLETKVKIHNQLGQTLLATRSYLLRGEEEPPIPIDAWKHSIALLRQEAEDGSEQSSVQMLVQTAKAFGITVQINGQMPLQKPTEQLLLEAAAEALTNAVRHADARTLYIHFSETNTHYRVTFQNDGKLPEGEIRLGGGLGSLRRKVERAGGAVDIGSRPVYTLTITIPKNGGECL